MQNLSYEQLVDKLKAKFVQKLHNTARQRLQAAEQRSTESLTDWHQRVFQLYSEAIEARATRDDEESHDELFQTARSQFIQRMYDPDHKMMCTVQQHTAPQDFDNLLEWAQIILESVLHRRGTLRGSPALMAHVVPAEEAAVCAARPTRPGKAGVKDLGGLNNPDIVTAINSLVDVLRGGKKSEEPSEMAVQPYRGARGGRGGSRGGFNNSRRGRGRGKGGASDRSFDSDSERGSTVDRPSEKKDEASGGDKPSENA